MFDFISRAQQPLFRFIRSGLRICLGERLLPLLKETFAQELPRQHTAQVIRHALCLLLGERDEFISERFGQVELQVFRRFAEKPRVDRPRGFTIFVTLR